MDSADAVLSLLIGFSPIIVRFSNLSLNWILASFKIGSSSGNRCISIQSLCMELFSSNPLYIASIHSYASLVIAQLITVVNCPHLKSNLRTDVFRPMALPNRSHWSRFFLQRANASSNWYPFVITIFIAQVSRKSSKMIRYSSLTSSGSFSSNRRMASVMHGVDARYVVDST